MARRTFFSFDYKEVWKVNQIRNLIRVLSIDTAGFQDASLWERVKKPSDLAIKRAIDNALERTTVTVVCVTERTARRKFIQYEIQKSLARGNGLVAVQIHEFRDQHGQAGRPGKIPPQIHAHGFKDYKYTKPADLSRWIEEAANLAEK
ncbi:TIR domain-containing protein [Candidatus Synechococcus spongiarum]|uniref:Thoeris protein ThsB TIR-like domain-containing protein n=1 Tax=Candidatus Synechococcus spongiarum LMB bulk15N TaxID=1943583 RepID=A0A1T1D0E5_9SYNE|nr:TIR domain-containing protein [Candidatus Synechococcus spongiarum]MCY4359614.1 TIR domain-containing protein [Cyanobacteria bacterium MAG APA_bin_95]OOV34250.1 hypothetical protein BV53_06075 [Candidatus Synechococcus spongiarum LMB bulk15N]